MTASLIYHILIIISRCTRIIKKLPTQLWNKHISFTDAFDESNIRKEVMWDIPEFTLTTIVMKYNEIIDYFDTLNCINHQIFLE